MNSTIYRTRVPAAPLSDYIDALWYFEAPPVPSPRERVLPDGAAQLIIVLRPAGPARRPESLVVGARGEYSVIDPSSLATVMGVHFKAGGTAPFLRVPASEIQGLDVPLEALWSAGAASELLERLLGAAGVEQRFAILEHCLLRRAGGRLGTNPAVQFALRQFHAASGTGSVGEVSRQIGCSARHFIQLFREEVGLTPKLYCRVRRFRAALERIARGGRVDWAEVAQDCGYFDQSHFVRDFQAFSGMSPRAYVTHRGEFASHVREP